MQPRRLGLWETTPGLNFICVRCNGIVRGRHPSV